MVNDQKSSAGLVLAAGIVFLLVFPASGLLGRAQLCPLKSQAVSFSNFMSGKCMLLYQGCISIGIENTTIRLTLLICMESGASIQIVHSDTDH